MLSLIKAVVTAVVAVASHSSFYLGLSQNAATCEPIPEISLSTHFTTIIHTFATKSYIVPSPPANNTLTPPFPPTPGQHSLHPLLQDSEEELYIRQLRQSSAAAAERTSVPRLAHHRCRLKASPVVPSLRRIPQPACSFARVVYMLDAGPNIRLRSRRIPPSFLFASAWASFTFLVSFSVLSKSATKHDTVFAEDMISSPHRILESIPRYHHLIPRLYSLHGDNDHFSRNDATPTIRECWYPVIYPNGELVNHFLGKATLVNGSLVDWQPYMNYFTNRVTGDQMVIWVVPNAAFTEWSVHRRVQHAPQAQEDTCAYINDYVEGDEERWEDELARLAQLNEARHYWSVAMAEMDDVYDVHESYTSSHVDIDIDSLN
ncbi:hypothetical protein FRC03_003529 [Tulasnella sp. 419]|nr:hypothetical protein FRC03_003529 [Tulasnella sp. 419]